MASSPYPSSAATFITGLKNQARVVKALILRETNSRFGRDNIGYLWVIGEPMMLASVITLIHLTETDHFSSDIAPAPFAIIGYVIFIIFRGMVTRAELALGGSVPLFYHRIISVFDLLFARAVLETAATLATLVILMGIAIAAGLARFPARPLELFGAIGLMVWWSFALSMIVARATYKNEVFARQVHVLTYFSIPISGAFFQLSLLPLWIQNVLEWWPMTIIFEQARHGQFSHASDKFVAPGYVSAINAVLTYLGMLLLRRVRGRL